ncbi:FAD-dependent monooxygenase [Streptomyces purpurogeneiscleroticus]|uniref:FAD-dependent monooxygenase n=1 Tax=Streptomyces purpurogeneiscleroticus TaxID=68259 RepID=UPI001CBEE665|nr:FAD-dependent monooxygenase [Streptomyces purpurogeneiscleroticus]MBZ4015600.1 FAD-dependent oxidoreductase [Streptomyces purpurogeneiscleroticus]
MTNALIIGGGIAGAVTAMALQKAGIESEVYEAYASGADDVGAFLVLFENGMSALRVIDADRPVIENSFPAGRVEFLSSTGKRLGERPMAGTADQDAEGAPDGPGPRTMRRATLYRVLHDEATRRGINVQHGKRLVAAETVENGRIVATFSDGTRAEGDLLIGADGVHSVTRKLIDPAAARPRYTGQNTVCGYTRDAKNPPEHGTYSMIFGKKAFFGCTRAPDGETWWFANAPGPELSRDDLAASTADQWRHRLGGLFEEDNSPAADIIRSTGETIVGSNSYDIAATPRWYTDTMVIIGDAAHAAAPNAAQGASMAIEDAIVLAKSLRDQSDNRRAFRAYEELRRERVEKVVEASANMARRTALGPVRRVFRDTVLPHRVARTEAGAANWLTSYRIEW